jgi:hypothetical protein
MAHDSDAGTHWEALEGVTQHPKCLQVVFAFLVADNGIPRIDYDQVWRKLAARLLHLLSKVGPIETQTARGRLTDSDKLVHSGEIHVGKFVSQPARSILVLNYQGSKPAVDLQTKPIVTERSGLCEGHCRPRLADPWRTSYRKDFRTYDVTVADEGIIRIYLQVYQFTGPVKGYQDFRLVFALFGDRSSRAVLSVSRPRQGFGFLPIVLGYHALRTTFANYLR